jgi:hypothetical protein
VSTREEGAPRLYRATKTVGIGWISAGFEIVGVNVLGKCAPILRRYLSWWESGISEQDFVETLKQHGFTVEEAKDE